MGGRELAGAIAPCAEGDAGCRPLLGAHIHPPPIPIYNIRDTYNMGACRGYRPLRCADLPILHYAGGSAHSSP